MPAHLDDYSMSKIRAHFSETQVPPLSPMTREEEAAYRADAIQFLQDEERSDYMAGWYWGVVCGVCAAIGSWAVIFAVGALL